MTNAERLRVLAILCSMDEQERQYEAARTIDVEPIVIDERPGRVYEQNYGFSFRPILIIGGVLILLFAISFRWVILTLNGL